MNIFEQIVKGEIPCKKVYEDREILAFEDINPQAPIHVLIIPKAFYSCLQKVPKEKMLILQKIILVAQDLAKSLGIEEGYRLLTNNGASAGQTVPYLHFHLLGGKTLGEENLFKTKSS